jgi:hypothetical protein
MARDEQHDPIMDGSTEADDEARRAGLAEQIAADRAFGTVHDEDRERDARETQTGVGRDDADLDRDGADRVDDGDRPASA